MKVYSPALHLSGGRRLRGGYHLNTSAHKTQNICMAQELREKIYCHLIDGKPQKTRKMLLLMMVIDVMDKDCPHITVSPELCKDTQL